MQLLRDNLTLWTSSDTTETEEAAPKDEKATEPKTEETAAEAPKAE